MSTFTLEIDIKEAINKLPIDKRIELVRDLEQETWAKRLDLEANISWRREFKNLLDKIHNRTVKFNSAEIEKDITFAYRQVRKIKNVRKSPH
jgi:Mg/Co/Ni transporter MgtE